MVFFLVVTLSSARVGEKETGALWYGQRSAAAGTPWRGGDSDALLALAVTRPRCATDSVVSSSCFGKVVLSGQFGVLDR